MPKHSKAKAIVTTVINNPNKGIPYAIIKIVKDPNCDCVLTENTVVTFALNLFKKGKARPKVGQCVFLTDIEEFARGWRAQSVEPVCA